jgi:heme exporter protein A
MQLVAENLNVERGGRTILAGLSFTVARGELLVLTGPNGAGKSSLLRAVAGFLPPAGGMVRLDRRFGQAFTRPNIPQAEQDVLGRAETLDPTYGPAPEPAEIGELCHYVGHRDGVKGSLTVAENARFWAEFLGGSTDGDRAADALDRVGLAALAGVPAAYLSAGQKRRLGLARLLLARRPLWLLDEPTVSLDKASVAMLAELIREHLTSGGLALVATHIPLGIDGARELRLGPSETGEGASP